MLQGDYDEPIEDCTDAIRLDPDVAEAYKNRGMVLLKKDELQKEIADFILTWEVSGEVQSLNS